MLTGMILTGFDRFLTRWDRFLPCFWLVTDILMICFWRQKPAKSLSNVTKKCQTVSHTSTLICQLPSVNYYLLISIWLLQTLAIESELSLIKWHLSNVICQTSTAKSQLPNDKLSTVKMSKCNCLTSTANCQKTSVVGPVLL